jgi:hypothetical protein
VRDAVIPALTASGIGVTQEVTIHEHGVAVLTTLWHESGQWLASEPMVVPVTKDDAQGVVAASTYGRRVALQAIACVVGDDDTDGNDIPKGTRQEPVRASPAAEARTAKDFITSFACALQEATTLDQLDRYWRGAMTTCKARGSSEEEVEKLRPLVRIQTVRIEKGDEPEFRRFLELHKGDTKQPAFGLRGEAFAKFAADIARWGEKGA